MGFARRRRNVIYVVVALPLSLSRSATAQSPGSSICKTGMDVPSPMRSPAPVVLGVNVVRGMCGPLSVSLGPSLHKVSDRSPESNFALLTKRQAIGGWRGKGTGALWELGRGGPGRAR